MNALNEHTHGDGCEPQICNSCGQLLWGCEFYARRKVCKRCHLNTNRNWRMREGNGQSRNWQNRGVEFTVADYERMLKEQDGKCAICRAQLQMEPKKPPLDHDHETGEVRGILCKPCNTILGLALDDPSTLLAAAQYLLECRGE